MTDKSGWSPLEGGTWKEKLENEIARIESLLQKNELVNIDGIVKKLHGARVALASADELQCLTHFNWLREIN